MFRFENGRALPRRAGFFAGAGAALALSLLLSGCGGLFGDMDSSGSGASAFDLALSQDYRTLSQSFPDSDKSDDGFFSGLSSLFDFGSSEQSPTEMLAKAFADKAELAASGHDVAPEPAIDAVSQATRARLMRAVEAGKDKFPDDAARAQADYDCWMLNASVASQVMASAQCRASLDGSLARLEAENNPAPPPVSYTPPPAPAPTNGSDYTVYFDFNSWTLTAEDLTVLTNVINTARAGRQSRITVVGHTDTSGSAGYNQKLSSHRANVVVEALVDMGARRAAISPSGVGERDLAVATADGVREAKNRRAVINLLP